MQVVVVDLVTPTMVRQEEVVNGTVLVGDAGQFAVGADGVVNSGGGGGGLDAADGGSGVVVVRYERIALNPSKASGSTVIGGSINYSYIYITYTQYHRTFTRMWIIRG